MALLRRQFLQAAAGAAVLPRLSSLASARHSTRLHCLGRPGPPGTRRGAGCVSRYCVAHEKALKCIFFRACGTVT
jgi:hypothetical protein